MRKKKKILPQSMKNDCPIKRKSFNSGLSIITDNEELIKVEDNTRYGIFGLACDLGTASINAALINLENLQEMVCVCVPNKQSYYGSDLKSRMNFLSKSPENRKILKKALIDSLNNAVEECVQKSGVEKERIFSALMVSNVFLQNVLFDDAGEGAGPVIRIKAAKLDVDINPEANIRLVSNYKGNIGSDILAQIIATDLLKRRGVNICIDLGTNFKVIVLKKGSVSVCIASECFSFEGFNISCGMVARPGAIEWIKIEKGKLKFLSNSHIRPRGICGSGIIDLIAELRRENILDEKGELPDDRILVYKDKDGSIEFTRADARKFMKHKAAVNATLRSLLSGLKISEDKISKVFISGALGSFLSVENIVYAGLVPEKLKDKIVYIANASLEGAKCMLISRKQMAQVEKVRKKIGYFSVCQDSDFTSDFQLLKRF